MILGFDPGRDKCGLAIMARDRTLHYHQVVAAELAIATVEQLRQVHLISVLVIGNQTTAKTWHKQLQAELSPGLEITLIDERYSTLEAGERYWQMYPPQGLARLIPPGMRTLPRPVDDIVAIVLIERYLDTLP
ncbi:MAG: pre-16S rRNA-processing nuclease YqgF [Aphanocapsa sp. GSE-SYN-MK-11-07L]|jgi:RNase H-fold protein (predicted Holliday junction resolvase)|nr:pre-16S rRNA-processing nuclease YqgF [Aphanocapsa sp. GSE-SYN-MK-11-07L]